MSPTAPHLPPSHTRLREPGCARPGKPGWAWLRETAWAWLRVLVVVGVLLTPGAAVEAAAAPVVAGEIVEYDVLDTALRPPACAHRAAVPLRPAPLPASAPADPADRPLPAPPRSPYALHALHALRSVVLRC